MSETTDRAVRFVEDFFAGGKSHEQAIDEFSFHGEVYATMMVILATDLPFDQARQVIDNLFDALKNDTVRFLWRSRTPNGQAN